jgi:ribosome-associated heat shock protein Hsp15
VEVGPGLRIDKWLWHIRLAKTRTLAQKLVAGGHVRLNRAPVRQPSQMVRPGDVLTVAAFGRVRVLRVVALGERRGPAEEARALYEDLTPPDARPRCDTGET